LEDIRLERRLTTGKRMMRWPHVRYRRPDLHCSTTEPMTMPFFKLGLLAALTAFVPPASPPAASKDLIKRVATLQSARAVHTATALPSGQVVFAGGMTTGGASLATAEVFDPADNTLRVSGSMSEPRVGHSATLLPSGQVLVAGGNDDTRVELFDPATTAFRQFGQLREARSGHTATLLPDGLVLFTGGVGPGWTFLRSAELFDTRTGRGELVGPMLRPRESHTATLLADGSVLIAGGHSGRRREMEVYASTEVFDSRTRRFKAGADLGTARHKHDALRLMDGRVLIIAGADRTDRNHFNTTEIYDPKTGKSASGPAMANRRYKINGTSILLSNGDVLVTSGAQAPEILDARTHTFRSIAGSLPKAYRFATATALPNGDVVIVGGYSDSNENTGGIWRFRRR